MDTLTKEDFWDPLEAKYPELVGEFKKWIDEYKQRVGWEHIFFSFVKYHDLPIAVQIGIFFQYMAEMSWMHRSKNGEQITVEEAVEGVTDYFEEETAFRAEPPKRFRICGHTCQPHKAECNNYCNMKTVDGVKVGGAMPDNPAEIPFDRSTGKYLIGDYESQTHQIGKTVTTPEPNMSYTPTPGDFNDSKA